MKHSHLERALVGLLLVIAGGVVLHAPLSVWLGTMWPQYAEYIKAWKELLMGLALVLLLTEVARRKMFKLILGDRLIQLALAYAGIHLLLLTIFHNDPAAIGAGLMIDLRYVFYFALVYVTIRLFPQYRRAFIWTFATGAVVVLGFALLQILVLPKDILANIGYGKQTIAPYLTVDENPDFIRINSTMRGPNPLGSYCVIVFSLLATVAIRWRKMNHTGWIIVGVAALIALLTLNATYSRSSVVGTLLALVVVAILTVAAKYRRGLLVAVVIMTLAAAASLYTLRNDPLVANIVLHNSPTTGAAVDSNTGHWQSLIDGTWRMTEQPLGAGIGSTGSASLQSNRPIIIENQYLLIAHEVGWVGLGIFVWLYVDVLKGLFGRRKSVLALGVFGSGVGLAVVGLLLPVWTDDTVSIVWWGLAAIALGYTVKEGNKRKKKEDA